jgi:hypothetical protein
MRLALWNDAKDKIMKAFRSALLWALWACMTLVFLSTLKAQGWLGLFRGVLFAADLILLFFAEGFEVSVINLSDKDTAPLGDSTAARHLGEVQVGLQSCLANRQIFVALAITAAALLATFPAISIPFVGTTTAYGLPALFPLAYVTLSVLWFAQVAPKLLAAADPEGFFVLSGWVWPTVRALSRLGLPDPGAQTASLVMRHLWRRRSRILLPPRIRIYYDCRTSRWVIAPGQGDGPKEPALSVKRRAKGSKTH